eukprot:8225244-Alexandrium_andersonii.AAC.1
MILGLGVAPRDLVLVIVYAPQDARSLDDKKQFYESLLATVSRLGSSRPMLIVGDFNARFYHRLPGEEGPL